MARHRATVDERATVPGTVTQVANPHRTTWRTFIQSAIGALVALNGAALVIQQFLAANPATADLIPADARGTVLGVLNGIVVVGAALAALAARLMANPTVAAFVVGYLPFLAPQKVLPPAPGEHSATLPDTPPPSSS